MTLLSHGINPKIVAKASTEFTYKSKNLRAYAKYSVFHKTRNSDSIKL